MFNNKMVAAIKTNGKILREFKDTVYIKFGSEYSILLKNLHTTRALVNVFIDGDNIVPGGLVIDPGKEIDLERSIRSGNLNEGNKLKFIERTSTIEQHRGVKLEDGIVRVEFQFERPHVPVQQGWDQLARTPINAYPGSITGSFNINGSLRGVDYSKGMAMGAAAGQSIDLYCAANNIGTSMLSASYHDGQATSRAFNDTGITVPGSTSNQKFTTTHMGAMENEKHSMVFKLLGETEDNRAVREPVTVKMKPKCVTCGKTNKATAKFCSECGTALHVV